MAHKYANFSAAYTDFAAGYNTAKSKKESANYQQAEAYSGASDPVDKLHFGYLCYAVQELCTMMNYFADFTETYYWQSHLYESIYWAAQGDAAYELTMQKILDTIWESNKLESFHFVNYIDAMRASIWNISIYEEHLHEWYRHFSE